MTVRQRKREEKEETAGHTSVAGGDARYEIRLEGSTLAERLQEALMLLKNTQAELSAQRKAVKTAGGSDECVPSCSASLVLI